jgi:hypothetical protein
MERVRKKKNNILFCEVRCKPTGPKLGHGEEGAGRSELTDECKRENEKN